MNLPHSHEEEVIEEDVLQEDEHLEGENEVLPSKGGPGNFKLLVSTQEEEDAFDYIRWRTPEQKHGLLLSIAYMVKVALSSGLLGGHVAYMKGGVWVSVTFNVFFGLYVGHCMYVLLTCAHILIKRTRIPCMSYPDVAEAALACFPNPKVARFSRALRHAIATFICFELFGACVVYQLIIGKTIKQLVEHTQHVSFEGAKPGYPDLRVYMSAMILPILLISLVRNLRWLSPVILVSNAIIVICIFLPIYYAFRYNPTFANMVGATTLYDFFEFMGMNIFSMSCAGLVNIENHMKDPDKYVTLIVAGMSTIVLSTVTLSFFGYAAFLDQCESPITLNFDLTIWEMVLKGCVAVMMFGTHALNFWIPFRTFMYYITLHHKRRLLLWEIVYRILLAIIICVLAIAFPNVDAMIGLVGTVCTTNMAFIWPNVIYLLVFWYRPGLGRYKWRLWKSLVLMTFGVLAFVGGSIVNTNELLTKLYS